MASGRLTRLAAAGLVGAVGYGCSAENDPPPNDRTPRPPQPTATAAGTGGSGAQPIVEVDGGAGGTGGADGEPILPFMNECDIATAFDDRGNATVEIHFPVGGFEYDKPCIKVKKGTRVRFVADIGNFQSHPLVGGWLDDSKKVNTGADSPFVPAPAPMSTSAEFEMRRTGTYGFLCQNHALGGELGAVFVVPD